MKIKFIHFIDGKYGFPNNLSNTHGNLYSQQFKEF